MKFVTDFLAYLNVENNRKNTNKKADLQEEKTLQSTAQSISLPITTHYISPVQKTCLNVQASTTSCF